MKIEVDLADVAAKEIAKRDRTIRTLKEANDRLTRELADAKAAIRALQDVKEAVINAAHILDPWICQ